jgi:hypothetical protein
MSQEIKCTIKCAKRGQPDVLLIAILLGLTLMILSSCRPEPERGYLKGTPCEVPCWQGITPAVTREEDMLPIIDDKTLVRQRRIGVFEYDSSAVRRRYGFVTVNGTHVSIAVENGIVHSIAIDPNFDLSLAECVHSYGPPDWVFAKNLPGGEICYGVYIFYVEEGLQVTKTGCAREEPDFDTLAGGVDVDPDMGVTRISLIAPQADLAGTLQYLLAFEPWVEDFVGATPTPWEGYGLYPWTPPYW